VHPFKESSMAQSQVDPARLEGEALKHWYVRPTSEIEEEREQVAAARRLAFFSPDGMVAGEGAERAPVRGAAEARRPSVPPSVLRPTNGFISYALGGAVPLTSAGGHKIGYYDHDSATAGLKITAAYAAIAPFFHPGGWADDLIGGR
jgi:hypothetical protein